MIKQFVLFLVLVCANMAVNAAEISGQVRLLNGSRPAASLEYQDVVVFFKPNGATSEVISNLEPQEMQMRNKQFEPRVLPIPVGSEVQFPNFDPILHNAFSTSRSQNFDLGFYSGGDSRSVAFEQAGIIRVYCNVHHDMVAYIVAVDTPHFAQTDTNGRFELQNVPANGGELFIWHPRSKISRIKVKPGKYSDRQTFDMKLTTRRIPKHRNKTGRTYRPLKRRGY